MEQLEMRMKLIVLAVFLWQAAPTHHTIFVVDKVTERAEAHNTLGGVGASSGEHHSAPVVMSEFGKKCSIVTFTQDRSVADYILETQPGGSTLTDSKANVLYVSPAKTLKNMVKDVCGFVSAR